MVNDYKVVMRIQGRHADYLRSCIAGPDNRDGPDLNATAAIKRLLSDGARWRRLSQDERETHERSWEDSPFKGRKVPDDEPPQVPLDVEVESVTGWNTGEILEAPRG